MAEEKKKKLFNILSEKFRINIINERTFEEKFSFRLSALNLFVFGSIFATIIISLTILLIVYTPLRQYVLGFSETEMKHRIIELTFKTDSLQNRIAYGDAYFKSIQKVLKGEIKAEKINLDSVEKQIINKNMDVDILPSDEELKLRQDIEEIEKYKTFDKAISGKNSMAFFSPAIGNISTVFAPDKKHFGVDIIAKVGSPVKCVANGVVVFSEWSVTTGNVLVIQHANNFTSVYKHAETLNKRQGDVVKGGEVIATVGNTGELSSGEHLHFELWNNGYPVDPFNFMSFK